MRNGKYIEKMLKQELSFFIYIHFSILEETKEYPVNKIIKKLMIIYTYSVCFIHTQEDDLLSNVEQK